MALPIKLEHVPGESMSISAQRLVEASLETSEDFSNMCESLKIIGERRTQSSSREQIERFLAYIMLIQEEFYRKDDVVATRFGNEMIGIISRLRTLVSYLRLYMYEEYFE